jgi:hypothetical protein
MATALAPPESETQNGAVHPEVPEDETPEVQEFVMQGNGQLSFALGSSAKKPTGASLRIVGGRVDVAGQFEKGEVVRVELVLRIDEIAFVDEIDRQTSQVVSCERRHKARMIAPPRIVTD